MISAAMEDYLKTMYMLGHDGPLEPVNTGALAGALVITAPSVTGMLKKLAGLGLVNYTPWRGATLTPAGETIALKVLRRRWLLAWYLSAVLGYGWDTVHDETDRLEHAVSDELAARIDAALGYPTFDPHGNPIPRCEGGNGVVGLLSSGDAGDARGGYRRVGR